MKIKQFGIQGAGRIVLRQKRDKYAISDSTFSRNQSNKFRDYIFTILSLVLYLKLRAKYLFIFKISKVSD